MHSMREFRRNDIRARDGQLGNVHDLYLNDETWPVRYVVVDTTGPLSYRPVLPSPTTVRGGRRTPRVLEVSLTMEQVRNSPHVNRDSPLSRQREQEYPDYHGVPYHWLAGGVEGPYAAPPPPLPKAIPPVASGAETGDRHLRSATEILTYDIEAVDKEVQAIDDLLVDPESWVIRYWSSALADGDPVAMSSYHRNGAVPSHGRSARFRSA